MSRFIITNPEEQSSQKLPPLNEAYCSVIRDLEPLLDKWESRVLAYGPRGLIDFMGFSLRARYFLVYDLDKSVIGPACEPDGSDPYSREGYEDATAETTNRILVDHASQILGVYRHHGLGAVEDARKGLAKAMNTFKRGFFKVLKKHTGLRSSPAVDWLPFDDLGNINRAPRSIEWALKACQAMAELKDAKKQIEELQCDALMGPVLMCQVYCFVAFTHAFPRASLAIKAEADEALRAVVRKVREEAIKPYVTNRIDRDQAMSVVCGLDGQILEGFKQALEMEGSKLKPNDMDKARTAAMQFSVSAMHHVLKEEERVDV